MNKAPFPYVFPGRIFLPGGASCQGLANTDPTPPRASTVSRICPKPSSHSVPEITGDGPVPTVGTVLIAIAKAIARSTISAIPSQADHATSSSSTLSITALAVKNTSTPTCPTSPIRARTIPAALSTPPSDSWSRTVSPIGPQAGPCGVTNASSSPSQRSRTGSRPGGKKAARASSTEHLDGALANFSGYIAADELYDGPFCILSIVDNRTFQRLAYQVLSRNPNHTDIEGFFRRFHEALQTRGLTLRGITTDGSPLYPEAITTVFGEIPHQICTFHVLHEITKALLSAVAKVRKTLTATAPKVGRGRPGTPAAKRAVRRKKRIERKVGELFEHRYLFVKRRLTPSERATFRRISRGQPQLRTLRELMEEVYRLFDRRCRLATALEKLRRLRKRLRRFSRLRETLKKLESPSLEKALVFLDERQLGATSNAVERGNRRYRKMQKTVYRVRTLKGIEGRLALDLQRERQGSGRIPTTQSLHKARAA